MNKIGINLLLFHMFHRRWPLTYFGPLLRYIYYYIILVPNRTCIFSFSINVDNIDNRQLSNGRMPNGRMYLLFVFSCSPFDSHITCGWSLGQLRNRVLTGNCWHWQVISLWMFLYFTPIMTLALVDHCFTSLNPKNGFQYECAISPITMYASFFLAYNLKLPISKASYQHKWTSSGPLRPPLFATFKFYTSVDLYLTLEKGNLASKPAAPLA